jgi:hypothetical protein
MRIEVYRSQMQTPMGTYYLNLTHPVPMRYVMKGEDDIDTDWIEQRLNLIDDDILELQELIEDLQ